MDWWIYKKCATSQILSVASWEACSLSSLIDTYILKIKNTRKVQGKLCCLPVTDVTAISHWQEQADENRTSLLFWLLSFQTTCCMWMSQQLLQINLTRHSPCCFVYVYFFTKEADAVYIWLIGSTPDCSHVAAFLAVVICSVATCLLRLADLLLACCMLLLVLQLGLPWKSNMPSAATLNFGKRWYRYLCGTSTCTTGNNCKDGCQPTIVVKKVFYVFYFSIKACFNVFILYRPMFF